MSPRVSFRASQVVRLFKPFPFIIRPAENRQLCINRSLRCQLALKQDQFPAGKFSGGKSAVFCQSFADVRAKPCESLIRPASDAPGKAGLPGETRCPQNQLSSCFCSADELFHIARNARTREPAVCGHPGNTPSFSIFRFKGDPDATRFCTAALILFTSSD